MSNFSYKDAILNKIPKKIVSIVKEEEVIQKEEPAIQKEESVIQKKELVIEKEGSKKVKKKINEIYVKKDSIPEEDDILRLCSHGMYQKIKKINNSHFNYENTKKYILYMHHKINEIKNWRNEPENDNENSKKRFKIRINDIYKTINIIKEKKLEYIDSQEKWGKNIINNI